VLLWGKVQTDRTYHITVIEDDIDTAAIVRTYLEHANYAVEVFNDGVNGLEGIFDSKPHLAIIDWMLPQKSGIEILRQLRESEATKKMPVILLTAKGEEEDRLLGFEHGADDYIAKPFSPRELVARVRALLNRSYEQDSVLTVGNLQINLAERNVHVGHTEIELTTREFDLLIVLAKHPNRVFRRQELLTLVWKDDFFGVDRVVDVHISKLRIKLEADDLDGLKMHTVRGIGYSLKQV